MKSIWRITVISIVMIMFVSFIATPVMAKGPSLEKRVGKERLGTALLWAGGASATIDDIREIQSSLIGISWRIESLDKDGVIIAIKNSTENIEELIYFFDHIKFEGPATIDGSFNYLWGQKFPIRPGEELYMSISGSHYNKNLLKHFIVIQWLGARG